MSELKCKVCGLESTYLDEVCYYDINGYSYTDEYEIELNGANPDALAHILCRDCEEDFKF